MDRLRIRYEEMVTEAPIEKIKEWIVNHKLTAKLPKAIKKSDKDEKILGKRMHSKLDETPF